MTAPSSDLRAWLARLADTHAAATVVGVLSEEEHRARLEAEWFALRSMPALLAAVGAVLDLADEMDTELAAQGFVLDGRCILPGDRLRAAVVAAIEGAGQ